jgi:hypothetical protein
MKIVLTACLAMMLFASVLLLDPTEQKNTTEKKANETEEAELKLDPKDRKMVACVSLFYIKKHLEGEEFGKIKNATISKEQKNKLKAMSLEKCSKTITESAITKIIDTEDVESIYPENEQFIHIDSALYEAPSFAWAITDTEKKAFDEGKRVL